MSGFAQMGTLDVWYAHLSEDDLRQAMLRATAAMAGRGSPGKARKGKGKKPHREGESAPSSAKEARRLEKRFAKNAEKARSHTSMQALAKLTEVVDGRYRIVSAPPVIVPARDLYATYGVSPEELEQVIIKQFHDYRRPSSSTAAGCWRSTSSSTGRARSWEWAAWAPARSSRSSRAGMTRIRCSSR